MEFSGLSLSGLIPTMHKVGHILTGTVIFIYRNHQSFKGIGWFPCGNHVGFRPKPTMHKVGHVPSGTVLSIETIYLLRV